MKYITIILFTVILCSCKNGEETLAGDKEEKPELLTKIILLDSTKIESTYAEELYLSTADFYPLYIGNRTDTIILNYSSNFENFNRYERNQYKFPESGKLEIFVDTSKIILNSNPIPPPPPIWVTSVDYIDTSTRQGNFAYPVYLQNLDEDTVSVGYGIFIPLIIEAVDSLGEWKPIQKHFMYDCGTGLNDILLPPDNYVLTSCKIFLGDYKTKFRLKYEGNGYAYSNEFEGEMNYSQFEVRNKD